AETDSQSAGRGPGAGVDFFAAPPGGRIDGIRVGSPIADRQSVATEPGAKAGGGGGPGPSIESPDFLSSQRAKLWRAGRGDRTAGQGGAIAGGGGDDGVGGGNQFFSAKRGVSRRILSTGPGGTNAETGRNSPDVWAGGSPGVGRGRLRVDHGQRDPVAGRAPMSFITERGDRLGGAAGDHERGRGARERPVPDGDAGAGTALHHQTDRAG